MQVTPRSRRLTRLNNWLFVVLLLGIVGLLAWLSSRYNYQADWTAGARHSLSEASVKLLEQAKGPVTVTAFARDTPVMAPIRPANSPARADRFSAR